MVSTLFTLLRLFCPLREGTREQGGDTDLLST